MNGNDAWARFQKAADSALRLRSRRLNVEFTGNKEPASDDVNEIDKMASEAKSYSFYVRERPNDLAVIFPYVKDGIMEVALRLRASLFFFELRSISFNEN